MSDTNSNSIKFRLMSEDDFKNLESYDTKTFTITNQDGEIHNEEQSATIYSGAKKLTDIVIVNEIPGVGDTYEVYIENNFLVIPNDLVSSALGNPNKLYVFFTENNYNIFVYNPMSTKYMQLGSSVSSGTTTSNGSSSVYSVNSASDIGDSSKYTAQTIVYYPQIS